MKFYVYELRDDAGKPFYVGKGSGKRIAAHQRRARKGDTTHRANKIRSIWRKISETKRGVRS
jgi:hypothetical protein